MVACEGESEDKIIGNIMYSEAKIIKEDNSKEFTNILCMGPLTVDKAYQKQGIGSKLLKTSIEIAKGMGYFAVVIFGHPNYYPR